MSFLAPNYATSCWKPRIPKPDAGLKGYAATSGIEIECTWDCVENIEPHNHPKHNRSRVPNSDLHIWKPTVAWWYTYYSVDTQLAPELDCIFIGKT